MPPDPIQPPPPPSSITPTAPGSGPGPIRLEAVSVAREHLGQAETGPNQGPIVEWSLRDMTSHPPEGDEELAAGWARWCSYFVSQCVAEVLRRRDSKVMLRLWLTRLASGSCNTLWANLKEYGWMKGQALPSALQPSPPRLTPPALSELLIPAVPSEGDIAWYGDARKMRHVGLVSESKVSVVGNQLLGKLVLIEGNQKNMVSEVRQDIGHERLVRFARLPW